MSAPTIYIEDGDETFALVTVEVERSQIADLVGFNKFDVAALVVDIVDGKLLLSFEVTNTHPPDNSFDALTEALKAAKRNPGLCGRH